MDEQAQEPSAPAAAVAGIGLVAAAIAPWLVLAPMTGVLAAAASALALAAAAHGAGVLLGALARRPDAHPLLAVQWGTAALIGALGLALAAGVADLAMQAVLLYGCVAAHTAVIAVRFAAYRARLAAARRGVRFWLVPCALLAALAILHVLGAAGDLDGRPFDDDGHVIAQLQRLRETGDLGDPIGYARHAQLGGQLVWDALATAGGDVHLARLAEGLAFVLALGLALARLRPPGELDTASGLWGLLLVLAGSAFTYVRPDPAPCWTAVGLVLGLHATLADRSGPEAGPPGSVTRGRPGGASSLPVAVMAGALIALRFELAPVAAVALAAAWWPDRGSLRRTAVLAAGALAVAAPFVAARGLAWSSVPADARAFLAPPSHALGLQLALAAGAAAACAPLVAVTWRERPLRWFGAGAALAIAGVASQLTGERPYATGFLWPLAIAGAIAIVIELARTRRSTTGALLISLVVMVLIYEGRAAGGRKRWARRYIDLALDVEYLRTARDPAPISSGYEPLLRHLPPGATVAVWVLRPDRLDYSAPLRLFDLRTPRAAWLRGPSWPPDRAPLDDFLALAGADYLLLEEAAPGLEAVARRHPVIAQTGGVRLIDLRAAR